MRRAAAAGVPPVAWRRRSSSAARAVLCVAFALSLASLLALGARQRRHAAQRRRRFAFERDGDELASFPLIPHHDAAARASTSETAAAAAPPRVCEYICTALHGCLHAHGRHGRRAGAVPGLCVRAPIPAHACRHRSLSRAFAGFCFSLRRRALTRARRHAASFPAAGAFLGRAPPAALPRVRAS
jgi:hypothetical protein